MLVDMHLHEKTFSTDSFLSLDEIVSIAKAKGLDAVCITDHNSMGLRETAEEYTRRTGFPIFTGIEFFSLQGDITAWGLESYPDHRIPAQDFIDLVTAANGFCVSCHPFRNNNRGLEEKLRDVCGLNGVEVLNGSTDMEANRKALRFCLGKYVTYLPEMVTTLPDFIAELRTLPTRPAIWNGSGYDVVDEF